MTAHLESVHPVDPTDWIRSVSRVGPPTRRNVHQPPPTKSGLPTIGLGTGHDAEPLYEMPVYLLSGTVPEMEVRRHPSPATHGLPRASFSTLRVSISQYFGC